MKNYTLILTLLFTFHLKAQEQKITCAFQSIFEKEIRNNPAWQQNLSQLEQFTKSYVQSHANNQSARQVYVIPVVVHILHEYGPENISDWQVMDGIRLLNLDFRKQNPDTSQIVPSFTAIAADCEIEFRLATLDPNGNCTNGIDRIFTPLTNNAGANSNINGWPNNMYLNIWTAASLENTATFCYAHLPGGPNNTDGIMMRTEALGSIGTAIGGYYRMLTHEIAHYLNLRHLNSTGMIGISCGDDSIADTPETMGWDHCDLTGSVCNPPIIENVQNFMEYSGCTVMFTAGQKAWMHAALNSGISGRNNLWTSGNLIATGTNGVGIQCSPVAQFTTTQFGCTGAMITFNSINTNVPVTSWSWTFPGGTPSASTDSAPTVMYNAPGYYDSKLVVTNAMGTDSISKTGIVFISDTAQLSIPYTEDFESPSSFPGIDGWIENTDSSATFHWDTTSTANTTIGGAHSIKIDNYSNSKYEIDSWVTPSLNFTNVTFPIRVSFQVANAQRTVGSDDELQVYYSTDCGKTWAYTSYSKSGPILTTAGIVSSDFTPTSNQWRQETVTVNAVQNQPNVRFRFTNISDQGNNIFIDDINITGTITGINETSDLQNGFTIFPNPTNDISYLNFNLVKSGHMRISVKDVLGKTIAILSDENLQKGDHEIKLPSMSQGIYFVDVMVNDSRLVKKWVVE